jgi:hypothetical protein
METFQDKDAKISFLQKAIDVVVLVSGEPLSVKPARIVAGHEPERTNELLQTIGKCCLNKVRLKHCMAWPRVDGGCWGWHRTDLGVLAGLRRSFADVC